jgi:hypothetical protein
MTKRVVIIGRCGPDEDLKALNALVRFVSDIEPDELVCVEQSNPLLERLREVYDGPIGVHAGNTDARFGATALPSVYDIAPGWVSLSKQGGYAASAIAGNTALNAAKTFNTCVVLDHTGRMGIGSCTTGYGGRVERTVTGMEIGTLMDRMTARSMGGQQGFGLLIVDGQTVKPEVVPFIKGRFTVQGGSQGRLGRC